MTHLLKQFFALFSITILFSNCISNTEKAKLIEKYKSKSNQNNKVNSEEGLIENNEFLILKDNLYLYPTSTTGQIIKHTYYTVSYSEKDEQPEWVAYKITNTNINDHIARTNDYREDPFVKTGSASPSDYSDSGYDMGHLAPAKNMSKNLTSMTESFYLSNICPQTPSFNRGIWKRLEEKIRYWSVMNDSIYEVTGPILDAPIGHIGENNVTVPRAFYKALLRFKNGNIKGIGFIMLNEKSDKSIYSCAVAIDEIEKITGIDFYYDLDKSIQGPVEENKNLKSWLLNK